MTTILRFIVAGVVATSLAVHTSQALAAAARAITRRRSASRQRA